MYTTNLPTRIYISRKDTSIRNVVNEDEVCELLSKYNFVTYKLSQLNFIEKVRLFANAEMIVSPTGAGLIHMYFSKPGTKVLEIFSNIFVVGPSFDIAGKVGLDYHYMIAKAIGKGKGLKQNIHVDVDQLKEVLENMIEEVSMPQSV
jgi:capsular polysaccharide biosynthesis protein